MRLGRGTFESILNRISANIYKTPTNMESNTLETHRQLSMTSSRLGQEFSFRVICYLLGVSIESSGATFNKVLWGMFLWLFNEYDTWQRVKKNG